MNASTIYYVSGVLLLGLPLFRLLRLQFRPQELDRVLSSPRLLRQLWRTPWLMLDFARALVGGWLLRQEILPAGEALDLAWLPPAWSIAVVVVLCGSWLQLLTTRTPGMLALSPAYVAGVALGLLPPVVSVPAVVLALTGMIATRFTHGFGVVGAAAVVGLTVLAHTGNSNAILGLTIFGAPTALAWLLPSTHLWTLVPVPAASAARAKAIQQLETQTSDLKL